MNSPYPNKKKTEGRYCTTSWPFDSSFSAFVVYVICAPCFELFCFTMPKTHLKLPEELPEKHLILGYLTLSYFAYMYIFVIYCEL